MMSFDSTNQKLCTKVTDIISKEKGSKVSPPVKKHITQKEIKISLKHQSKTLKHDYAFSKNIRVYMLVCN